MQFEDRSFTSGQIFSTFPFRERPAEIGSLSLNLLVATIPYFQCLASRADGSLGNFEQIQIFHCTKVRSETLENSESGYCSACGNCVKFVICV